MLRQLSWPELRHHPWRNAAALRRGDARRRARVLGAPDQRRRRSPSSAPPFAPSTARPTSRCVGPRGGFDEALYGTVAAAPERRASRARSSRPTPSPSTPTARASPLRLVGLDALVVAHVAPALLPRPRSRRAAPVRCSIPTRSSSTPRPSDASAARRPRCVLQTAARPAHAAHRRHGRRAAAPPLAVIDIAGAQVALGNAGKLSRIDVRLAPGADRAATLAALRCRRACAPPRRRSERSGSRTSRAPTASTSPCSRWWRCSPARSWSSRSSPLSVAQRAAAARAARRARPERRASGSAWCSPSRRCSAPSAARSASPLGTALAALALRLFGGDLGGGYFPGVAPALQLRCRRRGRSTACSASLAALVGGWLPARSAQRIAPAQALEGPRHDGDAARAAAVRRHRPARARRAARAAAAGARDSARRLRLGRAACCSAASPACPAASASLLAGRRPPRRALALLAVERARHQRAQRDDRRRRRRRQPQPVGRADGDGGELSRLGDALARHRPARRPLRARRASARRRRRRDAARSACPTRARALAGVARAEAQRVVAVSLDPRRPPVGADRARRRRPGDEPAAHRRAACRLPRRRDRRLRQRGHGRSLRRRAGHDAGAAASRRQPRAGLRARRLARLRTPVRRDRDRARRLAAPERRPAHQRHRPLARARREHGAGRRPSCAGSPRRRATTRALLEFAAPREIRATSLRIFDRSFAVTYWLQAVAIAIGLFGIAASFSAQVLARRKEFGLLAHLGLTRRQILAVVAAEGAVWTGVGALLGLRPRPRRQRRAGEGRQPAELSLDDGAAPARGSSGGAVRGRRRRGHAHRVLRGAARGRRAERAGGEGGLGKIGVPGSLPDASGRLLGGERQCRRAGRRGQSMKVLVGTASWSDKSLVASKKFYPKERQQPREPPAFLRDAVSPGRGRHLVLRHPARADGAELGRPHAGAFHDEHEGVSPLHRACDVAQGAAARSARRAAADRPRRISTSRTFPQALREALWQRFKEALEPLRSAGKLGMVHFQFAPWILRNRAGHAHVAHCVEMMREYTVSVEFRTTHLVR